LAGDFPVYATELSILVVILNWLQTLEKSSNATTSLLKRIDFGQISRDDLKGLEATLQNDNILHMLKDKRLICDTLTKKRDEVGLLNLRGMQLSIVKVNFVYQGLKRSESSSNFPSNYSGGWLWSSRNHQQDCLLL
jgi:hypothetical protein